MTELKPVYQHDCSGCEFLGTMTGLGHYPDRREPHINHDVYLCAGKHLAQGEFTIVCRRGDDGPDYWSSPVWKWEPDYIHDVWKPAFELVMTRIRKEMTVERLPEDAHVAWTKNLLGSLSVGGVWGIPRSGVLVTKSEDKAITIQLPKVYSDETRDMLDAEVASVTEHAEAAGYSVTTLTHEEPSDE
jgi:hypothetical protein